MLSYDRVRVTQRSYQDWQDKFWLGVEVCERRNCDPAKGVVRICGRAHKVWNCLAGGGANPAQCLGAATLGIRANLFPVGLNQSWDCVTGVGTQGVKGCCRLPSGEKRRDDGNSHEVILAR